MSKYWGCLEGEDGIVAQHSEFRICGLVLRRWIEPPGSVLRVLSPNSHGLGRFVGTGVTARRTSPCRARTSPLPQSRREETERAGEAASCSH